MTYEEAMNHIKPIFEASRDVSGIGLFERRPITVALEMAINARNKQIPKKPTICRNLSCPPDFVDDDWGTNAPLVAART